MELNVLFGYIGALATMVMGGLGLFFPDRAAKLTHLSPVGATGVSEIRATYGGLFVALGVACFVFASPIAYAVAGLAWAGAAAGRLWSVIIDRNVEPQNLGGIVFELAFAAPLMARWLWAS